MRKRWSINIFLGKLDLSLANMFKMCRLTAIKWTVKRESCKTPQWVVFQRGCWCTKYTSQSSGYLQPCGQIYHIICAESRGLHPCRPNLWTSGSLPPFSDRPIVGVLENHQLTDLLVWALAELRRGQPHRVTLQDGSPPLWRLDNLLYGHLCERSSKCTVTVKGDMNRTAALSRFIAAQWP